ncbi:MAG: hypothetical protein IKO41_08945 [Lachnospiraceae bacterium]|nr:hypothetical protein [Lachnospiraceae bacterium]
MTNVENDLFYKRVADGEDGAAEEVVSPYVITNGQELVREEKKVGLPVDAEAFRRSPSAGNSSRVMDALFKYPFLDRISLEACMSGPGKAPALDSRKTWDALKVLREYGIVSVWKYGDFCFYSLSPFARRQMEAAKRFRTVVPGEDASDAEILGLAGLCRWHAHAVSKNGVGLNVVRQEITLAGKPYLTDSYMEFVRSVRYRLFAYPVPRDGDFEALKDKIMESWRVQKESVRKGQASLTVLVAPSLSSAVACREIFDRLSETSGKGIYYALDSRRGPAALGLRGIYRFEDGGVLRSIGIE